LRRAISGAELRCLIGRRSARSQTFVRGTVLSWTHTPSGQVATQTLATDGHSALTRYTYDTRDRLTDIENADHSRLHYVYDAVMTQRFLHRSRC
jgi:uncharacterized protein RhaS with RHS repeats